MSATEASTVQTVIFDFGGVILRTHDRQPRQKWDQKLDLPENSFENYIFNSSIGRKAQHGQVSWAAVWEDAARRFGLNDDEIALARKEFFQGDAIDHELVAYIRRLKPHFTVGLLSNTWHKDGRTLLLQYGIADAFHFTVTSAEVGVMKPQRRVYDVALEKAGVDAQAAVFVDDMQANVLAARKLGMAGVYFVDPEAAVQRLIELTGVS